jgi:hypothetical protein
MEGKHGEASTTMGLSFSSLNFLLIVKVYMIMEESLENRNVERAE